MENAETVPLHFTLELENPRIKEVWMDENLQRVLHGMQWITIHGLLDFASSPPKIDWSNTKLGDCDILKSPNLWFVMTYCVEGPTWTVWQWNSIQLRAESLSLYTTCKGTWQQKFQFQFPRYGLRWVSRAPQFHGHSPWPLCKSAFIIMGGFF